MAENYSDHVSNLRRLAVTLQGVIAAADAMEKIGSIENHTAELEAARIRAMDAKHQAEEELEAVLRDVTRATQQAGTIQTEAEKWVNGCKTKAENEAAKIVADAKETARQEADRVTKERSEDLNRLLDELERKRGELFQVRREIESALNAKKLADAAAEESKTALDRVLESIANLKAPKVSA